MLRNQLARLGFPRRIDKWIEPIDYAATVGKPDGFRESNQSAVSWLSDVFLVFHQGGTKSEYSHEIVEPLDTIRLPEFESTAIFHAGRSARFSVFNAYRHRDGTKRARAKVTKHPATFVQGEDGERMFLEGRSVEFRDARIGDVLELRYARDFLKATEQGKFTWDHLFLSTLGLACARRRVTIAVHESVEHELATHHFDTAPEEWSDRGYQFRRWELRELPAAEFEDNQPPPRDCEPWIDISTCQDWKPIAKWLTKHLITSSQSTRELKDILQKHAPADLDLPTRAAKCYDYCREQVAYGRLHAIGPEANALPGERVAESQRGDCKDQTSLLRGLLTEIGVPCRAAAVHAGDPSRVDFLPSQRFDHVILACEVEGETVWLDPTAVHVVFGGIVPDLEGTRALLLGDDGKFEFATIPHTPAERNNYLYRAEGRFDERNLIIDLSIAYSGRFATTLRGAELHAPKSIAKGIESMATDRLGSCTVEDFELEDGWNSKDPFAMTMRITAPNWIKSAGSDIRLIKLPWLGAHFPATAVAPKDRDRAYLTGGPDRAEYSLELHLPDGVELDLAPGSREFRGPGQLATVTVSPEPGSLQLNVVFETHASRVSPDDYGAFRHFVHEFGGFFEDQHVLKG